jgi:phage protein D
MGANDIGLGIASARPTLEVDGQRQAALESGLLRLAAHDSTEGLGSCEAEFGNWGLPASGGGGLGYLWFDRRVLDFGKTFAVKLGDSLLFEGRVMALEGRFPPLAPPTLVLRADDALQALRMNRRTRSFEGVSDADLVRQVAGDHGLQADVDLPGPTWPLVVQANESDLAFLRRRALGADADLRLSGGKLTVRARAARAGGGAPLRLVQGGRLRHFSVCADLAHQRTELGCAGWDVAAKQAVLAQAEAGALGREAAGGDSGPQLLQRGLGARKDMVGHRVPFDDAGARAEAEAHLRALARRFVRGRGEAEADAALRAGQTVELSGLGPLFDGAYGVTHTVLRFDAAQGLRCEFGAERAWLGRP